jgi:POT family proton-dependent oligopeptide transporter
MSAACQSLPVVLCGPPVPELAKPPSPSLRHRHPAGFYTLCIAEFFERWAACAISASTVLLLCERYGHSRGDALRLAGLWNAAIYLATLPGGLAIDRVMGPRHGLGVGMALLAIGYAALLSADFAALYVALGLMLIGHALFKPSTQALIGTLYRPHDRRLDAAQITFYLVLNAGGTVGALTAGLLLRGHDFRILCAVAAAAMLAGLTILRLGKHTLRARHQSMHPIADSTPAVPASARRSRVLLIIGMTLAMMVYTIGFGQVEGSLFLWAQERTDRMLCGFEIPASWFVGLPAFLVLLLAPLQLAVLPTIQRRISAPRMVAWGVVAIGAAFAVLIPPALLSDGHRVSMLWLIACMTLLTLGELLVAPLGLSMILRLTPPRFVGVVVGSWYVAGALGYWISGELGAGWLRLAGP